MLPSVGVFVGVLFKSLFITNSSKNMQCWKISITGGFEELDDHKIFLWN